MKKRKPVAYLILLFGLAVMAYAGLKLIETQQVYREGDAAYDTISNRVRSGAPQQPQLGTGTQQKPQVDIPQIGINFAELKAINSDAVAWLYSPNTAIDYPVMKANDYDYYIRHLPDGTVNANGSLFIDFNNAFDFSDDLTVVYGHHMNSGKMFASITGYKRQSYFDEHPYMYLYTPEGNYRIDLTYGCVIAAGQWREKAFMFEENLQAFLAYADYNTTFASGIAYQEGDKVIALSTCSYEFDSARYVVLGILRPEYPDSTPSVPPS